MYPRFAASAFAVTLFAGFAFSAAPVLADENPATQNYASVLRTINPHLQHHQSIAYARSLLFDSERSKLDPNLIMALVTVESSWQSNAVSHSGARGLGQLMPTTAALLGVNPRVPSENLRGAATYLRSLVNRFAGRGVDTMRYAIGAYNAGPRAVEKFNGIPPYHETQRYVVKVLSQWHSLSVRVAKAFAAHLAPIAKAPTDAQWLAHTDASALAATTALAPAALSPVAVDEAAITTTVDAVPVSAAAAPAAAPAAALP